MVCKKLWKKSTGRSRRKYLRVSGKRELQGSKTEATKTPIVIIRMWKLSPIKTSWRKSKTRKMNLKPWFSSKDKLRWINQGGLNFTILLSMPRCWLTNRAQIHSVRNNHLSSQTISIMLYLTKTKTIVKIAAKTKLILRINWSRHRRLLEPLS